MRHPARLSLSANITAGFYAQNEFDSYLFVLEILCSCVRVTGLCLFQTLPYSLCGAVPLHFGCTRTLMKMSSVPWHVALFEKKTKTKQVELRNIYMLCRNEG